MDSRALPLIASLLLAGVVQADRRPNIVLVIGDDHAWTASGFMGDDVVRTPVLDRLAEEGTVFTHAQMPASHCRPSLQTLLSGLHPVEWSARRAVLRRSRSIPDRSESVFYRTLPRELAREGYRSWAGGKMWEGTFRHAGFTAGTTRVHHTGAFGIDGGQFGRDDWDGERCGPTRRLEEPCPAMAPLASFLDEVGDERFFLWFAPQLPHSPFDPPLDLLLSYASPDLSPSETFYLANVTRLDAVVGELLRELEARGLRDETLIVYLSDNGWEVVPGLTVEQPRGKTSLYELGMRTPLVLHWPGRVPRGVVRDDLVRGEDLFPTLLDYAGAQPLPDRRGISLRPFIDSGQPVGHERYVSFYRDRAGATDTGFFVRTPDWRYLAFIDGREELYAIGQDPFEQNDLSAAYPAVVDRLRAAIPAWLAEIAAAPTRLEVAGQLVTGRGRPIRGAGLRLRGAGVDLQVLTGADGSFRFQNLPHGRYRIEPGPGVLLVLSEAERRVPVARTGSYAQVVALPTAMGSEAGSSLLSGRVRTPSGAAVADTRVVLRHEESGVQVRVRSDAEGRYRAESLPAGRYGVEGEVPVGFRTPRIVVDVREDFRHDRDLVTWELLTHESL